MKVDWDPMMPRGRPTTGDLLTCYCPREAMRAIGYVAYARRMRCLEAYLVAQLVHIHGLDALELGELLQALPSLLLHRNDERILDAVCQLRRCNT